MPTRKVYTTLLYKIKSIINLSPPNKQFAAFSPHELSRGCITIYFSLKTTFPVCLGERKAESGT